MTGWAADWLEEPAIRRGQLAYPKISEETGNFGFEDEGHR